MTSGVAWEGSLERAGSAPAIRSFPSLRIGKQVAFFRWKKNLFVFFFCGVGGELGKIFRLDAEMGQQTQGPPWAVEALATPLCAIVPSIV